MSTPKLVSNPPQGSGLVPSLVDRHYRDLVQGRPGEHVVATCVLQPVGQSSRRTKDGIHTTVTYEVVRLEVINDAHDAEQATWLLTRAHDQRHSGSAQIALPFDTPAALRDSTVDAIREWGKDEGLTADDVNARWVDYFGGPENASSATFDTGSLVQLREFAYHVGALADDEDVEQALADAHDEDDDGVDDDLAEPDDEPVVAVPAFSGAE